MVKHLAHFLETSEDVHLITAGYYNEECPSPTPGKLARNASPALKVHNLKRGKFISLVIPVTVK